MADEPSRRTDHGLVVDPGPVADLSAWVPPVLDGARVVLRNEPGAVAMTREAFAAGLVLLVADPHDPASVRAAGAAEIAPRKVLDAAAIVLDRRLAAWRDRRDPATGLTAPAVLAVALDAESTEPARAACAHTLSWGGRCTAVLRADLAVAAALPSTAQVVQVVDPARRLPDRVLRKGFAVAKRVPLPRGLTESTRSQVERCQGYLAPARAARAVRAWPALDELHLVVSVGPLGQALVWRTLREHPEAASRSTMSRNTMRDVVRELTVRAAAGLPQAASAPPANG